jgi:prophage DNA circulation protein
MSDTLTSLTQLTDNNAPALSGLTGLITGLLASASWRGVRFYMARGEEAFGNRAVKFAYPGQARADFQFLGSFDGPMRVEGLVIGSDSVAQAMKLRAACQQGAKGKLRHPWFGLIDAVVTEPAHLSVSETEIGVVRFTATFERYLPVSPPSPDFFGQLQDAVDGLMDDVTDFLSDVMSDVAGPLALYSFATGLLASAATVWTGLGLGTGGSAVQAATAPAILALTTAAPAFDAATFAPAVASLLAAPALALANASQPVQAPAIGAGPSVTVTAAMIDPADAGPLLLAAAAQLAVAAVSPAAQAIALCAPLQAAAQAAAVGSTISFASTGDAATWRDQLDTALGGLQDQAGALAASMPLSVGPVWRAIATLRQAAYADCNARSVNLPSLLSITTLRTMDAWSIALTLCGDTPSQMPAAVVDLWQRNDAARNPAAVPAGTYAVLP